MAGFSSNHRIKQNVFVMCSKCYKKDTGVNPSALILPFVFAWILERAQRHTDSINSTKPVSKMTLRETYACLRVEQWEIIWNQSRGGGLQTALIQKRCSLVTSELILHPCPESINVIIVLVCLNMLIMENVGGLQKANGEEQEGAIKEPRGLNKSAAAPFFQMIK